MREMSDRFHLLYVDPEDADDYPDCVNVCFWYVPKRLRNVERDRQWEEELGKVSWAGREGDECTMHVRRSIERVACKPRCQFLKSD